MLRTKNIPMPLLTGFIFCWIIIFELFFLPRSGRAERPSPAYKKGELIIRYRTSSSRQAAALRKQYGLKTIRSFRLMAAEHVRLPDTISTQEAIEILRKDPNITWAEPNYLRRAMAIIPPDDSFFSKQWFLSNSGQIVNNTAGTSGADIQALDAWETTTDCSNVIIAIIDSGIDVNHPELKDNLWTNPGEIAGNGIDDDGNGYVDDIHGWNFVHNNNDISDSNDHGTHVAGVIADQGNNSAGTAGVCWKAKLMVLKFLDNSGTGSAADEINAIEYAIENNAKIINASFGESGTVSGEQEAIFNAGNAGMLFIASSGNQGFDNDAKPVADRIYPGAYDLANIITVAAVDQNDLLPNWSVYGAATVDLAAPGANILAAYPNRQEVWKSDFNTSADGWSLTGTWARVINSPSYLTDSPSANYAANNETTATAPAIDLSGYHLPLLSFSIRGSSESNAKLYLETAPSVSGTWQSQVIEITGLSGGTDHYDDGVSGSYLFWSDAVVQLAGLESQANAYIRFRFKTENTSGDVGWDIDDVTIQAVDSAYPEPETSYYQYLSGTSAAAPIVSGAAGLIWSNTTGLTYTQIKNVLLNGVDQLDSLDGKVVSGGRLNLYKSLQLSLSEPVDSGSQNGSSGTADSGSSGTCFISALLD